MQAYTKSIEFKLEEFSLNLYFIKPKKENYKTKDNNTILTTTIDSQIPSYR